MMGIIVDTLMEISIATATIQSEQTIHLTSHPLRKTTHAHTCRHIFYTLCENELIAADFAWVTQSASFPNGCNNTPIAK